MIATLTLSLISVVAPQLVQAIQAFGFSVSVTGKGCPPQNGQGLRWIFGFGGCSSVSKGVLLTLPPAFPLMYSSIALITLPSFGLLVIIRLYSSFSSSWFIFSLQFSSFNLSLLDRKSTRLNSSHRSLSRMPSSA